MGAIVSRVALVVACRDTARLGITGSFASFSIAGSTPTVDNVTRRGGTARPWPSDSTRNDDITAS